MSKLPIEEKLIRYLSRWSEGLSTGRMCAWIASCTMEGGYSMRDYDSALYNLRDSGRVACVNKTWYLKDIPTAFRELEMQGLKRKVRHALLDQFNLFSELRALVKEGITPDQNEDLITIAVEFITLAQEHDPDALDTILAELRLRNR